MSAELKRTPLFDQIQASGGRMVDFAGWEMPVQFAGLKQEHDAVRQGVGMFDISHMGKFQLRGQGVLAALDALVPSDLAALQPGQAQYTVLLRPDGGIIDDLIIYAQGVVEGQEQVIVIVNAATTAKDEAWLKQHLPAGISLRDYSRDLLLIAVQGPKALATLQPIVNFELNDLPRFGHTVGLCAAELAFIARTGYTGEDGVEIMLPTGSGLRLWRQLLEADVVPCGLGARDTLRLEAAMALYGQDIDEQTTPLEADLGWLAPATKTTDFIGREALEQQRQTGVTRRLVGLEMEGRHIARHGYPVYVGDTEVGEITSGSWAPSLEKAIALAYLPTALAVVGQPVEVMVRGRRCPATVVKRPFYRR